MLVKTKLLYKIPGALLYSRLLVSVLMLVFSFSKVHPCIIVALSVYAIVSDVLDGMIARKLKISTEDMRRLDTKIDTVFWFSCLFYLCVNRPLFLKTHIIELFILVFSELFIIVLGAIKFQERISYHTILSKCWALCLLWFFIDLTLHPSVRMSFALSFWYGLIVQSEIILIAVILKQNHTDIPFVGQALRLRKGLRCRRNRFFNG
jgi:CDP-diacylglycerol--glycerol-3-phosphate 3-phosphatidyltransferase